MPAIASSVIEKEKEDGIAEIEIERERETERERERGTERGTERERGMENRSPLSFSFFLPVGLARRSPP